MNDLEQSGVTAADEWRRHGLILPACLFGMVMVAMHNYSLGVLFEPLQQQFGWSRSEISMGPLLTSIATVLLAPFGGRAVDLYGPRRIALIGVPFFAIALALIGTAGPSLASWLAVYALLAVALIFIYPTVWTAAIAARFNRSRGLALAVALSGTGLAAAIVPLSASHLLQEFGWRGVYYGLGAMAFLIAFPLVLFLFDRTDKAGPAAQAPLQKASALAEFRSGKFIRLVVAAMVYSVCATMLGINAVPILMGKGFDVIRAAEIAGLIGVGTIIGRIAGGLLLDRIDGRYVAVGSGFGAFVAAAVLLAMGQDSAAGFFACFMLGLAAGAELDACAYLTTRHFQPQNFGTLFGFVGGVSGFAAGMSPIIANFVFDQVGSYDPVLWAIMPLLGLASILFLSLGRYPDWGIKTDVAEQPSGADA